MLNFAKYTRLTNIKMFEEFISSIKRRFSKTSDNIHANVDNEKTGYKHRIYLFKKKLNKPEKLSVPANTYYDDPMLSPRALGSAENAKTEIAWPIITDSNPNILDKFTKIIDITDEHSLHNKVRNKSQKDVDYIMGYK